MRRVALVVLAVAGIAVVGVTAGAVVPSDLLGSDPAERSGPAGDATDTPPSEPAASENESANHGEQAVKFDGGIPIQIEATDDAVVSGTTDHEPGTELSVRIRTTDDDSPPFIKSTTTTVGADGTFDATFDLSAVTTERAIEVSVYDGNHTTGVAGEIVAPEGGFPEDPANVEASIDGQEPLEFETAPNQTVEASTDLDEGESVSVRMQSADNGTRFLLQNETTVAADGSLSVAFNLTDVEAEREVTVTLVFNGETVAAADGRIVASSA